MKLYRTTESAVIEYQSRFHRIPDISWDDLICLPDIFDVVRRAIEGPPISFAPSTALAPIVGQEVWAAGVTYYRSRDARIEESKDAGGSTFYDRVYSAERPELFFKSAGWRVIGPGGAVRVRSDATWSVPEPEVTLVINSVGQIIGYTIGNDMSSRDIEAENPLYLPQAKVYDGSCALGPAVFLSETPIEKTTKIAITIVREGQSVFSGSTSLAELKRSPEQLVACLFSNLSFPKGVFLMTGTGIVPADDFTLNSGDVMNISIDGLGTLSNFVA